MSEYRVSQQIDSLENLLAELTSGDDERAEKSVPLLVSMGDTAVPALLKLLKANDQESRWWAVRVLASSQFANEVDWIEYIEDPASEVRSAIALALCSHPTEKAVPALIGLLDDADDITAGLASKGLAAIGASSVPALMDRLANTTGTSRHGHIHALRALAEIGDHRAIPVLLRICETGSAIDQYWAKSGLDRLGLDMICLNPE